MAQCVMPVGFIAPYTSLPVLLPARLDTFESLLLQITLADVSMSLDNVLAVAGAAKGSPLVLVIGLAVAIVLMAVATPVIRGAIPQAWIDGLPAGPYTALVILMSLLGVLTLIGATPDRSRAPDVLEDHAQKSARINTLAGDEFNRGVRSYYFGFAALGWFLHVALFAALTALILIVLWRRDFRSPTMRALAR